PPASQTYLYTHSLVNSFQYLLRQRNYSPLILIPLFVLDYLCIHPFQDGNGRTARLWTLLLLYQAGFTVGKYISLERIIEQSKETYYESLEKSSQNWHEEKHDPQPWLRYFYGTLLSAYKEFEARAGAVKENTSKTKQVKDFIDRAVLPFSIADIEKEYPSISKDMIRFVIRELRDADKIYATNRGRGAKWIKK
ncbi:MAG: Fic family protein, partial [Candidatus Omnitrophica bacterium]|nr:Fic family protein [Candidatus Omnitrophota bacterium]